MAINVADSSITTSKIVDSSITPEKMNMNYVSMIGVNGIPVTGIGSYLNITGGNGVNLAWDMKTSSIIINGAGTYAGSGRDPSTLSIADTVAFWNGGAIKGTSGGVHQVLHGDGGVSMPTWGPLNLAT